MSLSCSVVEMFNLTAYVTISDLEKYLRSNAAVEMVTRRSLWLVLQARPICCYFSKYWPWRCMRQIG